MRGRKPGRRGRHQGEAQHEQGSESAHALKVPLGHPLTQRQRRAPLSLARSVAVAADVCDALAAAHAAGIVHRDLKPANIMVSEDGVAKVLDFGLAKRQSASTENTQTALTMAGTVVGTPGYMSPEQAKGEAEDWRTDIFSFGVILYEIVCGRRPFEGRDSNAILYQITHEDPPPPPMLAPLIMQCLKRQRTDRPPTVTTPSAGPPASS